MRIPIPILSFSLCLFSGIAFGESYASSSEAFLVLEGKAREVITYHCGSCHTLGETKIMTKPLKVFNLSDEDQWFKKMSVLQLEKSKKRLIDRTSKSISELTEDFLGSGNKPRKPTETELDIYAKFVAAAIQKKLNSPFFTE